MKNIFLCIGAIFIIFSLLTFSGCKVVEEAKTQFTLTVIQGTGVSGIPSSGTYTYDENHTITYNYTAQSGYEGLSVTLDGVAIANSGFISMTQNHTLEVTAFKDISGNWKGWHAEGPNGEGIHYSLDLDFSGGGATGTITGTEGKSWPVTGTYTLNGDIIEFTLEGSALSNPRFTGSITSSISMSGTYNSTFETGVWELDK